MQVPDLKPKEVEQLVEKIKSPDLFKIAYFLVAFDTEHWPEGIKNQHWIWDGAMVNKGRNGQPYRSVRRDQYMNPRPAMERYYEQCIKYFRGKNQSAARVAYRIFIEELGDAETVRHWCNERRCINPLHYHKVLRKPRRTAKPEYLMDSDAIEEVRGEIERIYAIHNPSTFEELYEHFREDFAKREVREALNQLGGPIRAKLAESA